MEKRVVVKVREGLHARPAARFVKLAKSFDSSVELARGPKAVNAKSTVKLMLLAVKEDEEILLRVSGPDEEDAGAALAAFLSDPRSGLDGDETLEQAPEGASEQAGEASFSMPADSAAIQGIAASRGVAMGPVFAHFTDPLTPPMLEIAPLDRPAELQRLRDAFAVIAHEFSDAAKADGLAAGDRAILGALADIATDETLISAAESGIQSGEDALSALLSATETLSGQFRDLEDPYLRARGDDIAAVGRRVALQLLGRPPEDLARCPAGAVVIADDIAAFDLARADHGRIAGLVCGAGGATSHIAIIARSHSIPAVLGLGAGVRDLAQAERLAVDGTRGTVIANPGPATAKRFEAALADAREEKAALQAYRDLAPHGPDGRAITIAANLGSLEEIDAAREAGAMGVGLFRTELLFMRQRVLPDEEAQYQTYKALVEAFPDHPVIVRTLDIGGDKPVAGIAFPHEDNPFLGWRGIRMCLDRPDVFVPQLRALLRAARHGDLKVMLPMVSTLGELAAADRMLKEARQALAFEGVAHGALDLGIMMETPAAVMIARDLARRAAFFSIGTNDLTQYIMAADRLNPAVASLNRVDDPAVMAAIAAISSAGNDAGIMVGLCGEAGGDPTLAERFLAMGITELSMSPASILAVKKTIADLSAAAGRPDQGRC
ncbi:MAG: phosphoenolpyruvate--protein phosphotransferase [Hyphomicrobiaceae bacterium]|nr:phosphoenolpyruvate--protein phosphotransferase [Hyphomicrobiaceae bacterium]